MVCLAQTSAQQVLDTDFVFADDQDGCGLWRPHIAIRRWNRLRSATRHAHIRLHDLRHFVATELLTAGFDVRTVSNRLGHARTSTTMDIYWGWVPARDQEAASYLGALLSGVAHQSESHCPRRPWGSADRTLTDATQPS